MLAPRGETDLAPLNVDLKPPYTDESMGERMKPRQLLRVISDPHPRPTRPPKWAFLAPVRDCVRHVGALRWTPAAYWLKKARTGTPVVLGQTKPPICGGGRRRHDPLHAARAQ